MIDRPEIGFDEDAHAYTVDGVPVPGVSTVAKVGADLFSPGAWWGYGLAIEGAMDLPSEAWDGIGDAAALRAALRGRGIDPTQQRDRAGERGTSVHDALEQLAQHGRVPNWQDYPEAERGHVRSLVRWFLHYRPEFEATEVVVGSREHGFAGRYDLRVKIRADRLPGVPVHEFDLRDGAGYCVGLVDLKTSKSVYPDQHFPQLGGYELASREMGFLPTDFQAVLRTSPDGSFTPHDALPPEKWEGSNFVLAWGDPQGCFVGYLHAFRAREALRELDPKRVKQREDALRRDSERSTLLDALQDDGPATGKALAEKTGLDPKVVSRRLQDLRKAGLATCSGRTWSAA